MEVSQHTRVIDQKTNPQHRRVVFFVGIILIFQLFIVVYLGLSQPIAKGSELLMLFGLVIMISLAVYTLACVIKKQAKLVEFVAYLLTLLFFFTVIFLSIISRISEVSKHHPHGTPQIKIRNKLY
jgi:hypothetical protein